MVRLFADLGSDQEKASPARLGTALGSISNDNQPRYNSKGASLPQIAEQVRHGLGVLSPPILEDDTIAEPAPEPVRIELHSFGLDAAERRLCEGALERAGSLQGTAALLGIECHALRRRMVNLKLADLRVSGVEAGSQR